jgi:hypothetical protein
MICKSILDYISELEHLIFLIKKQRNDPNIQLYFRILKLDINKINHFDYIDQISLQLLTYPTIHHNLSVYIYTGSKSLNYLTKFSSQQIDYITDLECYRTKSHTKLLACPGSGKTRSIIGRIKFLVENNLFNSDEIFVVTFSKFASLDFILRVKQLFPDYESFINIKNISTIDSLAKSILNKIKCHKSENVELLSIAFRNFLKASHREILLTTYKLNKMKCIFIDEAQDLNPIQYDIIVLLKDKINVLINLIGDPNQNIYQFRNSSDKYLVNFPAKIFNLTINFRSSQNIITFSQGLQSFANDNVQCHNIDNLNPLVKIFISTHDKIHKYLIKIINTYQQDKSNIAIICPTRGIKSNVDIGLSVIFNLLKKHNIKFNQLYDESGCKLDRSKKEIEPIPGEVNLLTYHGTKGLEFDLVILMDFFQNLFCIKPSEEEHNHNKYLLYVAASRAKNQLIICCYSNKIINQWITKIDPSCYKCNIPIIIPKLSYRSINDKKVTYSITDIIESLDETQLNRIHDMIKIDGLTNEITRRIYPDYITIDRGRDEIFFGILGERLFLLQHRLCNKLKPQKIIFIEKLLNAKFVIINDDKEYDFLKRFIASRNLTWEKYDSIKNELDNYTTYLIGKYFNRDMEFEDVVICKMEFISIIENNKSQLFKCY